MRLAFAGLALLLAGCAQGPPEDSAGPADSVVDLAPQSWTLEGEFVVDYTHRIEVCPTGFSQFGRGESSFRLQRPDNATWLNVTFDWMHGTELAKTLRFALVGRDGYDSSHTASGATPVHLALSPEMLAVADKDPQLGGDPVDCDVPISVGSSPGQTVHYVATWS